MSNRPIDSSCALEVTVVGAGPYGLSLAAHLRERGIQFRIFGRPMDSWKSHMPQGMMLKSDNFASSLSDPGGNLTLERFCTEQGIEYHNSEKPVSLETFTAYGLAFGERMVPELEDKLVTSIQKDGDGFVLQLDDGETVRARRVVLAVGITNFGYVPRNLADLPAEFLSHSFSHHNLEPFRGRDVIVVGGGASASDLAGLLHDAGAQVRIVARNKVLRFHNRPATRSLWARIRHPRSGLGPGLRSCLYANAPTLFHLLPESLRLKIVRRHLGPAGGWFAKEKVMGKIPLFLGCTVERAEVRNGKVSLRLRTAEGGEQELVTDHVIAATGYRPEVERLRFLSEGIRGNLRTADGAPVLSSKMESSVPGLYFVGLAAANSFGPLMRFAFGADFAARHIARVLGDARREHSGVVSVPSAVAVPGRQTN